MRELFSENEILIWALYWAGFGGAAMGLGLQGWYWAYLVAALFWGFGSITTFSWALDGTDS